MVIFKNSKLILFWILGELSDQVNLSQNKERPFQNILLDQNWLDCQRDSVDDEQVIHNIDNVENDNRFKQNNTNSPSNHSSYESNHSPMERCDDRMPHSTVGNLSQVGNVIDSTDISGPDSLVINETFENNETILAQQDTVVPMVNGQLEDSINLPCAESIDITNEVHQINYDSNCTSNRVDVSYFKYNYYYNNYNNYYYLRHRKSISILCLNYCS